MIIDKETGRKLLDTTAGMHISIFVFGYPVTKTTFSGYILNDDGEYSIYKPRQWNHLCMAWSTGGKTKIVLVRNMNTVTPTGMAKTVTISRVSL